MTDVRSFYEKDYVGAWDIPEDRDVRVTIEKVIQGHIPEAGTSRRKRKPLLYFKGKRKPMVFGATVRDTIAEIVGSYDDAAWAGKEIVLFRAKTEKGGKEIDCIRVRPRGFVPRNGHGSEPIGPDAPDPTEAPPPSDFGREPGDEAGS